jgi:hypothetical protein
MSGVENRIRLWTLSELLVTQQCSEAGQPTRLVIYGHFKVDEAGISSETSLHYSSKNSSINITTT